MKDFNFIYRFGNQFKAVSSLDEQNPKHLWGVQLPSGLPWCLTDSVNIKKAPFYNGAFGFLFNAFIQRQYLIKLKFYGFLKNLTCVVFPKLLLRH